MKNTKSIQIRKEPHTSCDECPVRKMALFQGIPQQQLEWTKQYREHQFVVPPKKSLYLEHTIPDYVYTLFDGWMAMYQTSQTGKRQILRFALPGDFLGYQADAKGKVLHSVSALTESIVCGFPRDQLKSMFEENPPLALRLANMESRDMALCQQHQTFGSRKDAHASIAFLLLELFHRTRLQMSKNYNAEDNSIVFPITQEEVGDAVGLTNVHVNRVLRQFTKDGLIECHHRKLRVIDEDILSEIGEFNVDMLVGNPLF